MTKKNNSIGIVGQGFVGTAVMKKFSKNFRVIAHDRDISKCGIFKDGGDNPIDIEGGIQIKNIVSECDIIFICVPTPMFEDGECNTSIVESVIEDIAKEADFQDKKVITIIKSTIPPGTTELLNGISSNVGVTFSPEFLTEANATGDFENQNRIVLGIDYLEYIKPIREIFETCFPSADIICINSNEAEMVKYTTNLFLATKVSFFNDIYSLCEKLGINYDNVIEATMHDTRIGKSHYSVPGPDGDRGFGGHCFPGNYEISTPDGNISLADAYTKFKNGELIEVISTNHNISEVETKIAKEITKNEYSGPLYKFTMEDGSVIECTESHLFPINRNGTLILIQAKDILDTDEFYNRLEINNKKTLTSNANSILR